MVRSYWIGPLFGALALTGLAQGQTTTIAVPAKASDSKVRYVTVGDLGKPGQKCRVLKTWTMPNGHPAYQVQALDTGELMTIEESAPVGSPAGVFHPKTMRIFHWDRNAIASPHGSPEPPPNAVVLALPFKVPSRPVAPPLNAPVQAKAHHDWPSAFVVKKPGDSPPVGSEKRLAPAAPPVAKNAGLTPVHSAPVVAKVWQPLPPPRAKNIELTPLRPKTVAAKPMQAAPAASAPVVVNPSPYNANPSNAAVLMMGEAKPQASNTTATEAKDVPPVKSPYLQADVKPAPAHLWYSRTTWTPAVPPPAAVKHSESTVVKAPAPVAPKTVTTPAQPKDWRESWGKIPSAKLAPVRKEDRAAMAAPKFELPHAVTKADDPLSTPEKYAKVPKAGAFGDEPKEAKRPLLALLAPNPPASAPAINEKKPESHAAAIPSGLPISVASTTTAATAAIAPPTVVKIPPPAPAQLTPPPAAVISPPGPAEPTPAETHAKAEPKPTAPLGMQSVLAAQSPELAPPVPRKPTASSQAQAMGIDANESNAFTESPAARKGSVAANSFWAPWKPAPVANPGPGAVAWRAPFAPLSNPRPALAPAAASPVTQVSYRQETSPELSQLSVVMHESYYPSQREWAADRLASFDWRRQPQVVELLMERAKQDPAPMVRAECVRSLGLMKPVGPGVIEALKSFKSDADPRVRQAVDEALANLTGTDASAR